MDSRIARGIVRDRSEELAEIAWDVHKDAMAIFHAAASRLSGGKRLRPEDMSRMRRDLEKIATENPAVVASRTRTCGRRTCVDMVIVKETFIGWSDRQEPAPAAAYNEAVQALRVIAVEWDRRRVFFADVPTFVDIAEHVRRRFLERGGAADDIVPRLWASTGILLATAAAARRASPQAAHWPLFVPSREGMTFGAAAIEPVNVLTSHGFRFRVDGRAEIDLPPAPSAPFGVACGPVGEDTRLVHALRTFVDNDALHDAQTALHARLLPLVERHAEAALAEFRRCFVDFEPAPAPAPGALALLDDVAAALATPEGREASAYADQAWRTANRSRLSRPDGQGGSRAG